MSPDPLLGQIIALCATVMNCPTPEPDDDLVRAGYLDSLALVELLFALEQELGVTPPLDDLDVESLRTPRNITAMTAALRQSAEGAA
jgi:D-alanine--poly(phosphoribitol) ligase subunit 2